MSVTHPDIRTAYVVTFWHTAQKRGLIQDKNKVEYTIDARNFLNEDFVPAKGDIISGICLHFPAVTDIDLERHADGSIDRERADYDSAGPCPDAPSWEPRGTPDTGMGGGRPDSGDSRKRAALEAEMFASRSASFTIEPTREQLLERIRELESRLANKE
jgi:hypothetical protein